MIKFRWLMSLLCVLSYLQVTAQTGFTEESILKSGTWFRFKIEQTGVYKITYENLSALGFSAPENVRIYGNGGAQLPELVNTEILDDLQELAIYQSNGNSDFGPGDYYLFYAEEPVSWSYSESLGMFIHDLHDYSETNYYYLTSSFGSGQRLETKQNQSLSADVTVTEYDYRDYHEEEQRNFINSGRNWYGESFADNLLTVNFDLNVLPTTSSVKLYFSAAVRSASNKSITVSANSQEIASYSFGYVLTTDADATYADVEGGLTEFTVSSSDLDINVELLNYAYEDYAYLDYMLINSRSKLSVNESSFFFRDFNSVAESSVAEFQLSGANSNTLVWDITNHNEVAEIESVYSGSTLIFRDSVSTLKEYVAVDLTQSFSVPIYEDNTYNDVGWLEGNQNLHGLSVPELLIVTHPAFIEQSNELAELHRQKDDMKVEVVTTEQVYNEFSSGKVDAVAIRNLGRMFYERSSESEPFKYLLLFGDGSFDNRSRNENNPNYIPTFQTANSISSTVSYSTDDIYGMFDSGEWSISGTLDIGIGRIPVKSTDNETEAQGVVDKIAMYYDSTLMKDWRNQMIFLGDDGESGWDNEVFMVDSDSLTRIVEVCSPTMNFTKIYLDAYEQISTSTGASYPDVEDAIQDALKKGALVFNYMGHGGESGITQEKVLQKTDIENLTNSPYFPLFITATCQLSRFDNVTIEGSGEYVNTVSAGEAALLNTEGGAIAMLTTTRLVYQSSNMKLSRNLYWNIFSKDDDGNRYRLGDLYRIAKNKTTDTSNKFKFALLGDPAITLAYGEYQVITDSINSNSVEDLTDTVNALGSMIISGHVAYNDSTLIADFNGVVEVNVYDKEYYSTTRGNDDIPVFDFTMQDNLLFSGKATVIDGRFSIEFKIPKDISYSYGAGKVSYYAQNGLIDAKGYSTDFLIGGTSDDFEIDIEGPEISLYMNDVSFEDGGITNADPVLLATVYDESGVNTTGVGIGHDITGVLDEDYTENYSLNDYYEGELDDYRRGTISYPMNDLEKGGHEFLIKVWDIYNNSSEETISFYVTGTDDLVIDKVYNYPNPMQDYTYFQYSHNYPGDHEVILEIYDITGKLIYTYSRTNYEEGFVSEPMEWNCKSSGVEYVDPGVYVYRLKVNVSTTNNSSKLGAYQNGQLIIMP